MKKYIAAAAVSAAVLAAIFFAVQANQPTEEAMDKTPLTEKSIYDFTLKSIDGSEVKMDQYKGKTLMIVNVASQCGYTYQYDGMQKVYSKYKDQGFVMLGFPANNFGAQEPGSNEEIKTFCTRFKVSFPMFAKISVKGADKHPFYRFLTEKETDPEFAGEIKWNFNKFLVDKTGKIVARFDSGDDPDGDRVVKAIEQALK
jgi:glutathione peroxidase